MKKIVLLFCLLPSLLSFSQIPPDSLKIAFLASAPVIDGRLDPGLDSLKAYSFGKTDCDSGVMNIPKASFRIAYGTGFLYICAEIASDSLVFRDRGYQNGDGMLVMIGKPENDGRPTREFYILGFTAQPEGSGNWQEKFVWYRNVDLAMYRLTDARFVTRQSDRRVVMECLIPWPEVYPYHPWLSGGIGLNLVVIKGTGQHQKIYYSLKEDDRIESEQSPRRYIVPSFTRPHLSSGSQAYAILSCNHIPQGENVKFRLASCSAEKGTGSFRFIVYSGEHERVAGIAFDQEMIPGITVTEKEIPCHGLSSGGYQVSWNSVTGDSKGNLYLTVMPGITIKELMDKLNQKKNMISKGTYATLMFMLQDIKTGLDSLKPYETAYSLRIKQEEAENLINAEKDVLADRTGIFRRGFFSAVDSTYRPYSVKVPEHLVPGRKYPLMVFLHGSGQDDRDMLEYLPDYGTEMILLSPNGRGTSNCYTAGHAQEDIEEALRDVISNYPVDTTRIILAGFSMGGYGVYRTFYEHPSRYRLLAVFSGNPSVGRRWMGADQPDFLDEKYLAPFAGKKIFIFHGSRDMNLPIEETQAVIEKLRKAGADVTFAEEPIGHESPGEATIQKFREWLRINFK